MASASASAWVKGKRGSGRSRRAGPRGWPRARSARLRRPCRWGRGRRRHVAGPSRVGRPGGLPAGYPATAGDPARIRAPWPGPSPGPPPPRRRAPARRGRVARPATGATAGVGGHRCASPPPRWPATRPLGIFGGATWARPALGGQGDPARQRADGEGTGSHAPPPARRRPRPTVVAPRDPWPSDRRPGRRPRPAPTAAVAVRPAACGPGRRRGIPRRKGPARSGTHRRPRRATTSRRRCGQAAGRGRWVPSGRCPHHASRSGSAGGPAAWRSRSR